MLTPATTTFYTATRTTLAEALYVHGLIQHHAPGARSILEMGCGTGAHAAEFAGLGYEVHGIDASEGMLEGARARQASLAPEVAARLAFSAGDVRSFRAGRRFDVVTALFHVVSYQVTNEDLALDICHGGRPPGARRDLRV